MKILVASDIHGSSLYLKRVLELYKTEGADKLILLGDVYNHGPRNPLPDGHNPMEVASLLNAIKDNLIVIKGNCDSQVDQMISEFDFIDSLVLEIAGKYALFTHGHIYNIDNPPKTKFDLVIYGHFHTGFIKKQGKTTYINAGSTSLPKLNTSNSYLLIDNDCIYLKDLNEKVIDKIKI